MQSLSLVELQSRVATRLQDGDDDLSESLIDLERHVCENQLRFLRVARLHRTPATRPPDSCSPSSTPWPSGATARPFSTWRRERSRSRRPVRIPGCRIAGRRSPTGPAATPDLCSHPPRPPRASALPSAASPRPRPRCSSADARSTSFARTRAAAPPAASSPPPRPPLPSRGRSAQSRTLQTERATVPTFVLQLVDPVLESTDVRIVLRLVLHRIGRKSLRTPCTPRAPAPARRSDPGSLPPETGSCFLAVMRPMRVYAATPPARFAPAGSACSPPSAPPRASCAPPRSPSAISTHRQPYPVLQDLLAARLQLPHRLLDVRHVALVARDELRVPLVQHHCVRLAGEELLRDRFERGRDGGCGALDRLRGLLLGQLKLEREKLRTDLRVLRLLRLPMK